MKLSIVIPAFNEQDCLPTLVQRMDRVLKEQLSAMEVEVIIVDDHSSDNMPELLSAYKTQYHWLKSFRLLKNSGSHIAILAGLSQATGNWAFCMGADLQDPPENIPLFIQQAYSTKAKIVFGERIRRTDQVSKIIPSRIFNFLMAKLIMKNYPTNGGDVFLIQRNIIDAVVSSREKNVNIFVLMLSFCDDISSVPYVREQRLAGESKWNFVKLLKLAYDSIISVGTFPLKFMFWLGLVIFTLSLIVLTYVIIFRLTGRITLPGWASTTSAIVLIGGLQMISLSIIGEYLWRNFDQTRSRPIFLFEKEQD